MTTTEGLDKIGNEPLNDANDENEVQEYGHCASGNDSYGLHQQ